MTKTEFMPVIKRMESFWGKTFDDFGIKAWYEIFGECNVNRLLDAINELSTELKFIPKPADIVEKYELIRQRQARNARKKQQNMLPYNELHKCPICRNYGVLLHDIHGNGYEHFIRCSCGRGKDLNRFSRHQITKGMTWNNPATKEDESLYIPDVDDILKPEEIGLIKARNMSRDTKISSHAEAGSMIQNLIQSMSA